MSSGKKVRRQVRLELTHRAIKDLRAIEEYSVETWGRAATDRYLGEFAAALDRITQQPDLLRLEPEFSEGLYFYRVKQHFLACDFHEDLVIVLTVIHTSMDISTRLQELEPRLIAEAQLLRSRLQASDEQSG